MKKIISLAVCFVMPFVLMGAKTAEDTPPTTSAQAFVLYCPDNNTVICSKNAEEQAKLFSEGRHYVATQKQNNISYLSSMVMHSAENRAKSITN